MDSVTFSSRFLPVSWCNAQPSSDHDGGRLIYAGEVFTPAGDSDVMLIAASGPHRTRSKKTNDAKTPSISWSSSFWLTLGSFQRHREMELVAAMAHSSCWQRPQHPGNAPVLVAPGLAGPPEGRPVERRVNLGCDEAWRTDGTTACWTVARIGTGDSYRRHEPQFVGKTEAGTTDMA